MIQSRGYAAQNAGAQLAPFSFERRDPGPRDVVIEILYCGICHTDIHQVRDEWGGSIYPMVPGHEIVGRVVKTGGEVKKFKEGDLAGVGCMVDSCGACPNCEAGEEQFCDLSPVFTYNSRERATGAVTYGGYSNNIVVDEGFTLKVSPKLELAAVAPLLCAGITTYSPLRHWKAGDGKRVGVVGLGGLGHMALKFARSFGAHVVQFTTSLNKKDDAMRLGAHEVVLSKDEDAMQKHAGSLDLIIDTVSAAHDLDPLVSLLKRDGTLTLLGAPDKPPTLPVMGLLMRRRSIAGSLIGGIAETQEMLDYCAEHGLTADVEVIPIQDVDQAFERMLRNDVKYRFVIDMASLGKS